MKQHIFYDNFLVALEERYPQKSDLVTALIEILNLEKESIYRRLRRDVFFSADEVMRIASAWNISLDNIICASPEKIRPFQYEMVDYNNPAEADYAILERFNRDLELVAKDPDGKIYEVLNALPRGLYAISEPLTRFATMKWLFKYGTEEEVKKFRDIKITDRMRAIEEEHQARIHAISEIHSFLDSRIYENVAHEIAYFHSIDMISDEEKELLRQEMLRIIDYSEDVSRNGSFESGTKLHFHLSHLWVDMEYILYESKYFNMSTVRIVERNTLVSVDPIVNERLKNLVDAMRQSSVLLSGSNILQQREFFNKQRKIISSL
jgi:hypothetical protein